MCGGTSPHPHPHAKACFRQSLVSATRMVGVRVREGMKYSLHMRSKKDRPVFYHTSKLKGHVEVFQDDLDPSLKISLEIRCLAHCCGCESFLMFLCARHVLTARKFRGSSLLLSCVPQFIFSDPSKKFLNMIFVFVLFIAHRFSFAGPVLWGALFAKTAAFKHIRLFDPACVHEHIIFGAHTCAFFRKGF